jgi:hypothetical protein
MYVKEDKWESCSLIDSRSASVSGSASVTNTYTSRTKVSKGCKRKEVLPGEEVLREAKEVRELNEQLSKINQSLREISTKEYVLSEEVLFALEMEA